jgi:Ni/Co efflux regulator RcnB
MKRRVILSAAVAVVLAMPGFALAQGYGDQGNRERDNRTDHNDRDNRADHNDRDNHADHNERGAGPRHAYHRGDRLPREEHRQQYVVNDWRARHLRQPPKGEHWVRSGDDYVLAAIATGVIADIVLNNH